MVRAAFRRPHSQLGIEEGVMAKRILAAACLGFATYLAIETPAEALIACNPEGDCWHTERRETVPGVGLEYHPDDWYFHRDWNADRFHHWREFHEGRGYWHGGVWVQL
jgi:hypothetical protein